MTHQVFGVLTLVFRVVHTINDFLQLIPGQLICGQLLLHVDQRLEVPEEHVVIIIIVVIRQTETNRYRQTGWYLSSSDSSTSVSPADELTNEDIKSCTFPASMV